MQDITQWFTLETLSTPAGAALALWLVVQVTKDWFDGLWRAWTGKEPKTLLYAMVWAYFIVFGTLYFTRRLTWSTAYTGVLNGMVAIVMAGLPSWVGKGKQPDAPESPPAPTDPPAVQG